MLRDIKRAMLYEWDPIGVSEIEAAHDEYDSYAIELTSLIRSGISENEIFTYLWDIETQHMGLEGDRANTQAFAAKVAKLRSI